MFQLNTIQRLTETCIINSKCLHFHKFQLNTIQRLTETPQFLFVAKEDKTFQLNTIQRLTETSGASETDAQSLFQLNTIQRLTETQMCQVVIKCLLCVPIKHYPTIN